jgi:ElaB/YqjD/DUF883 family membrane-anchored ribosome-binding protein
MFAFRQLWLHTEDVEGSLVRNFMEVYYKDLISEDASLEKLVEDLSLVVQGAEEFAQEAGATVHPEKKVEISTRLQRLKEGCFKIRAQAIGGARATDEVLRRNPYSFAGFAFVTGLLAGVLLCRSRRASPTDHPGGRGESPN